MLVTIMADASFCPDIKCGSFGYWVVSDRGKKGGGGILQGKICHNVCAEMKAVVNAVYIAIQEGILLDHDTVLIQSDCIPAIDALNFHRTNLNEEESNVVKYLNSLTLKHCLNLRFKHVKGHSNRKERRFVSNNICDEYAYKYLVEARKLHKRGEL